MVTDAPAQVEALGDSFVLHGSPMEQELEPLSTIVAASRADERCTAPDRDTSRVQKNSVFVSLGMAGTEVLLANAVFHSRTARE